MRMFVSLDELKPIIEGCGFTDVNVDMSNSEMQFEIEEEVEEGDEKPREYNEAGRR